MEKNAKELLDELKEELKERREVLIKEKELKEDKIKEIELYLLSLMEKEESDFKFFSPHNIENIYKDDIVTQQMKKQYLTQEDDSLREKVNVFDGYLEKIDLITIYLNGTKEELREENFMKKDYRSKILQLQEQERQRMARDLHDYTVQDLVHLIHKIELSTKYLDKDVIQTKMELMLVMKEMKKVIGDIRNIIYDLRPMSIDDLGFKSAMERLELTLKQNCEMNIVFKVEEIESDSSLLILNIYHIIKECCNNAIKHSDADKLSVNVNVEKNTLSNIESIKIQIEDNGKGFNKDIIKNIDNKNFGLTMIKERVFLLSGSIQISSIEDSGTVILIEIPKEEGEVLYDNKFNDS